MRSERTYLLILREARIRTRDLNVEHSRFNGDGDEFHGDGLGWGCSQWGWGRDGEIFVGMGLISTTLSLFIRNFIQISRRGARLGRGWGRSPSFLSQPTHPQFCHRESFDVVFLRIDCLRSKDCTALFSLCELCLGSTMQVVLELLFFYGSQQSTSSSGQPRPQKFSA